MYTIVTRHITLILTTYVAGIALVALVAYVLIPGSGQVEYLRDWNAYLILILFLAFVGLLLRRVKWPQPMQKIFTVALLILVVYGFSGFRESFEFKVLQDEAVLVYDGFVPAPESNHRGANSCTSNRQQSLY